jgi:hypothetical protein
MVAKTQPKKRKNWSPRRTPAVILKQAEAVRLKVAGHSYDEIARMLGYADHTGARGAVRAGLNARLDSAGVEEVRQVESERLDRIQLTYWQRAVGETFKDRNGDDVSVVADPEYAELVLKVMDRRARLLGLNAPVKIGGDPNNPFRLEVDVNIDLDFRSLSTDELRALLAIATKLALTAEAQAQLPDPDPTMEEDG